mmetsp:Transcript_28266/g.60198  ORF Transcript_28266/g.60198 Transcript_28266/m.60198 type:complete len:242 (-) Transcript_28266:35-760(-)
MGEADRKLVDAHYLCGYRAADEFVTSGMVLAFGSGPAVVHCMERVGERMESGELKGMTVVSTCRSGEGHRQGLGLPLAPLDVAVVDVMFDVASSIDPGMNAVIGEDGAVLKRQLVRSKSKRLVVLTDYSRTVPVGRGDFPIFVALARQAPSGVLHSILSEPTVAEEAKLVRTAAGGLHITEDGFCLAEVIIPRDVPDLQQWCRKVLQIRGVMGHGLFCAVDAVVIGHNRGTSILLQKSLTP